MEKSFRVFKNIQEYSMFHNEMFKIGQTCAKAAPVPRYLLYRWDLWCPSFMIIILSFVLLCPSFFHLEVNWVLDFGVAS